MLGLKSLILNVLTPNDEHEICARLKCKESGVVFLMLESLQRDAQSQTNKQNKRHSSKES
jgi:hypothetical protein